MRGGKEPQRLATRTCVMSPCPLHACSWSRYGLVERRTRVHGCAARAAYVMAKDFRYISNEYTLHGGMHKMGDTHLCPQFVNVVMLRWVGRRRGCRTFCARHPDDFQ